MMTLSVATFLPRMVKHPLIAGSEKVECKQGELGKLFSTHLVGFDVEKKVDGECER